jgi:O-antigen/teichoic acid export membrane protein
MRARNEAALNFLSYVGGRVVALVVFGIAVPLALKSFGTDRYAIFSTLVLVLGFVPLLDAGFGYSLTYRYSRIVQRKILRPAPLLSEHSWAYFALALVFAIIFLVLFPWLFQENGLLSSNVHWVALWGALATFFVCMSAVGRAVLVSHRKTHVLNFLDIGTDILRGAAIYVGAVLLSSLPWTVFLIASAYAIRFAVLQLLCWGTNRNPLLSSPENIRGRSLRTSLSIGAPVALTTGAIVAFGMLDKALIARQLPLSDLTSYSLAYDIVIRGWMIVWAINGAVAPIMMRWQHTKQTDKLSRGYFLSLATAGTAIFAVYLPLNIFEPLVMGWWIGDSMALAIQPHIALLSVASVFYVFADVTQNYFRARGQAMLVAKGYLAALAIYVPILIIAIHYKQTIGAAGAQILLWAIAAGILGYFYVNKLSALPSA